MLFKNYYAVLGVAPNASEDDIKKKFRKLALLYHPDRNADNEFASIRFQEIQEAYETLSDSDKRVIYNRSWRDHYPKVSISVAEEMSPESILLKCKKLQQDIREMDSFRINQQHIQTALHKILNKENIALLLFHNDKTINEDIVQQVLSISNSLPRKQLSNIQQSLSAIAEKDDNLLTSIDKKIKQISRKKFFEQNYPLLAFALAIVACIVIYVLSSRK